MKKNYSLFTIFLSFALSISSFVTFAQTTFTNGVFVLNEGISGTETASVSFIKEDLTIQNNIYATVNPSIAPLGNTGQSINMYGDYIYIANNISNTVKVVDKFTFQYVTTITNHINNPRYTAFSGNKGYITNWGAGGVNDGYVGVYNLTTGLWITSISVDQGPEKILENNGKIYVANKGGFSYGATISVINPATDTVEATINVGDVPDSMVVKDGIMYVLCGGKPSWSGSETYGSLHRIDLATNAVLGQIDFSNTHPSHLKINGEDLFYAAGSSIFKTAITATSLPTEPFINLPPQNLYGVYGMDIIDGKLYVGDARNYVSAGNVYVYEADGTLSNTYVVGYSPNGFMKSTTDNLSNAHFTKLEVSVYPNPASDVIFINTEKETTVALYDISGRLIKTQNYATSGISISDLNKGIYMLEITIDGNTTVKKIIKK